MADPSEQDYVPGTTVIRSLVERSPEQPFGTPSQERLDRAELLVSMARAQELYDRPVEGSFGFSHYREVHRRLFQDVYAWAGDPRRVPMTKLGTEYVPPLDMNAALRHEFQRLADAGPEGRLRGIEDRAEFCEALADHWASINHAHAFREGNTRSQTVFFHQLAKEAGYDLDVPRLDPAHPESLRDEFVAARFEQQRLTRAGESSTRAAAAALSRVLLQMVSPSPSLQKGPAHGEAGQDLRSGSIESRDPDLLHEGSRASSEEPQFGA